MAAAKVFVSAGTPGNETQEQFRQAVVQAVELSGLTPRLMDSSDWDYKNPLRGIKRAMDECQGAIVIAYARYQFPTGVELRQSGNKPLEGTAFPTLWNHIEGAMAYEMGLPLLVVAQKGLREDAILESTSDIRPFWCELQTPVLEIKGFKGYLRSWKDDIEVTVKERTQRLQQRLGSENMTIKDLFSVVPAKQLVTLGIGLASLVAAAATFGYRIGAGEWPFG